MVIEEDSLVDNCSEELETWKDLSFGDRGLDDGGYFCDPYVLGCDIVRSGYRGNVDIYLMSSQPDQETSNIPFFLPTWF